MASIKGEFLELESDLHSILDKAESYGVSYADIRYQEYYYESILVENKVLKNYSSRKFSGVGIRVIIEGAMGYASTCNIAPENLLKTLDNAINVAKALGKREKKTLDFEVNRAEVRSKFKVDPINVSPEEKTAIALDANKAAFIGDKIKNALTRLGFSKDNRLFMSTNGAKVRVETIMSGLWHESVAKSIMAMERVGYSESKCSGFEFISSNDWNNFSLELSKLAIEASEAGTSSAGTYPVVVDPEVIGLLLHEAFGHASEGDLVSTRESVLFGKVGEKVASDTVTIVDDNVENGYFYPYDDEGTEKKKVVVVEDGILKGYLHDTYSASKLDSKPTGNGRAQDFENIPIVRQTNYFMLPKDYSFEELIEDIDYGIYVGGKGATGGQVDVGMGTFTFSVGPSKVIRNGKLAEMVRGVVISGLILDTLKTVDAVGKDLSIRTNVFGGCGKMGQTVRVGFGGPHVRVQKMIVGGR
ncbi:MAG: TldD/PmbA family protein [Nitrososphaeria archaeon]|nr:TldD/PmbA family protein [Nitrososphaeria archaeon]